MKARRQLVIVSVLILIGAAINLPLAMQFVTSTRFPIRAKPKLSVHGADAARYPWPVPAAAGQPPWPPPDGYEVDRIFGHTRIHVWGTASETESFSAQADYYGWPLPCVAESNRWWSWDSPRWKSGEMPEAPLHVVWTGTLLNPLMFGLGVWLLFIAPFVAWHACRRWLWRRRAQCESCGYPLVPSGTCPECGAPTASASVAAASKLL